MPYTYMLRKVIDTNITRNGAERQTHIFQSYTHILWMFCYAMKKCYDY